MQITEYRVINNTRARVFLINITVNHFDKTIRVLLIHGFYKRRVCVYVLNIHLCVQPLLRG